MTSEIFLLDLDGVLIRPGGYRAAVRASMSYLLDRLGLDLSAPGDDVAALFESQGVTSEWDMVSILLALVLNAAGNHLNCPLPALPLEDVLDWISMQDTRGFRFDFAAAVRALSGAVPAGGLPMAAMQAVLAENAYPALFARLDHQPFVSELFNPARAVDNSLPTRLVQNYVLGHRVFEQTYRLPAPDESASLLVELDSPALSPGISAELRSRWRSGQLYLAAFTARPSLPPRGSNEPLQGYSPEAEMALSLVKLEEIPIMGYGRLQWLARQVGGVPDEYLKPAVEQPLSAAYAALTGREAEALLWAVQAARGVSSAPGHPFPAHLHLHVFEDSPIGLTGGRSAALVLQRLGVTVQLHLWGVTTVPEKEAALLAAGAQRIFHDVNAAVQFVLG